jgi:hypothetical protein
MTTFSNLCKTSALITAIYGWFIPVSILPPLQTEIALIEIEEIEPIPFSFDFEDSFLSELEEIETEEINPTPRVESPPKNSSHPKQEQKNTIPDKTQTTGNQNSDLSEAIPTTSLQAPVVVPQKRSPAPLFSKKSTKKKQAKHRKTKKCTKTENPNIKKISSTAAVHNYSIPQKLIRYYSKHWKEANQLASLRWSRSPSGIIQGIRIKHIYCRSPLQFSGLKKGDIVVSVNGRSVHSNAALLKLYPRVIRWKKIELAILRKGKPLKLEYTIS